MTLVCLGLLVNGLAALISPAWWLRQPWAITGLWTVSDSEDRDTCRQIRAVGFVGVVFCGAMLTYVVPALLSLITPRWVPFFRDVHAFTTDHAATIVGALVLTMLITQVVTAFLSSKNR